MRIVYSVAFILISLACDAQNAAPIISKESALKRVAADSSFRQHGVLYSPMALHDACRNAWIIEVPARRSPQNFTHAPDPKNWTCLGSMGCMSPVKTYMVCSIVIDAATGAVLERTYRLNARESIFSSE